MSRGRFITFEGGEGAGKSTQARRLADRLREQGREVVVTREPGGSPGAEAVRELVVAGEADRWSPTSEALLMYAARADHLERLIAPALERGAWVVCDRFFDSTRAYQGAAGQASAPLLDALESEVVGRFRPDLTLILDLPPERGLSRAQSRGEAVTRFEAQGSEFHHSLREAFLRIARVEPERCVVVDADHPADQVQEAVWSAVQARLAW